MRVPRSAWWLVILAGCAASGSDAEQHGPSFVLDAGARDAASDAALPSSGDAATANGDDASPDASPADDASVADAADAADAASPIDAADAADGATCASTIAIVAGGASTLFGAVATGTGAFAVQALAGEAKSAPAVIALGGGFVALARSTADALVSTRYAGTWSAPAALGSATTIDAPSLAPLGAGAHATYLGPDHKHYHAAFDGASWGAPDPVGKAGGVQAYGPTSASIAALASSITLAYEGGDLHPYAQSWTAGAWGDGVPIASTSTIYADVAPAIVPLGGAAADLLVVFVGSDTKLYASLHDPVQGKWLAPSAITGTLTTTRPSLSPLAGGGAIAAWRGTDGKPYASTVDAAGATWSTPAPLVVAANPSLAAGDAPSVARGVCGDDAVAAYVDTSGAVKVTRLRGGAWLAPVTAGSGATFAAIATRP